MKLDAHERCLEHRLQGGKSNEGLHFTNRPGIISKVNQANTVHLAVSGTRMASIQLSGMEVWILLHASARSAAVVCFLAVISANIFPAPLLINS